MKKKKLHMAAEFDREREVQAWFELVRSEIKGVAEGHSILLKGQEEIKSELGTVKQAVIENSTEIKELKIGQEEIKYRIGAVEGELSIVKVEMSTMKSELKAVKQAVFEDSARLKKVEEKLDSNLANHESRIVRLEEKVGV